MSTKMKDGGPAFPQSITKDVHGNISTSLDAFDKGVSKRELFAAMALQGYVSNPSAASLTPTMFAEIAVKCADALLAELEKGKERAVSMSNYLYREWVYDPKAARPVWVCRHWHKIGAAQKLETTNGLTAYPGDMICSEKGHHWILRKDQTK